ncbi:uncharacterized protein Z520_02397 [Fonsecaea multimorphosa CBS 102226]|uniref:FAD dependent oxidoreductase domain-containing protein n=1 Tax=Fonsecaea multimorphosa CBS 102226 TaxID=1442371 RepID=A0A0D2KZS6_9EURO|nr:uncharacterized protein Z520_02397 [Fonsecaea multimorphosa CBS 102226]KIY02259.1 hypothetical protein Z520_02397 [Fonsecaea multimorphosa CBS 102226]
MAIASQLPLDYDVTIVGEHLPGDPMNHEYTSQWAGAIWLGVHDNSLRERKLQLDGLAALWKLSGRYPESSARKIMMREVQDYGSVDDVWYKDTVPQFRVMSGDELPQGAKWGVEYQTIVITPPTFIAWLRGRLESRGVVFKRLIVRSLADLKDMGHDVLINATAYGSVALEDVRETRMVTVKQQNIRIRMPGYNRLYIRRGQQGEYYSTAFGRGDGTIYIGGIRKLGVKNYTVNEEDRKLILRRQHENQPDVFKSPNLEDYDFICDHVGVYPFIQQENGGVRIEKEIVSGQKVVHAYGTEAGGFVYSFGLGREVARLVSEYVFEPPKASL